MSVRTQQHGEVKVTEKIIKFGKYRHYKRTENLYQVIDIALHSETYEEMVIYKALYHCEKFGNNRLWVRPKSMFLEDVEYNGKTVPRFQLIDSVAISTCYLNQQIYEQKHEDDTP